MGSTKRSLGPVVLFCCIGVFGFSVLLFALLSETRMPTSNGAPPLGKVGPPTLQAYINREKANKFCSVECFDDTWIDWTIDGLEESSTGQLYLANVDGWSICISPEDDNGDCDCVPKLTSKRCRVRGQILGNQPKDIHIWKAVVEPLAMEPIPAEAEAKAEGKIFRVESPNVKILNSTFKQNDSGLYIYNGGIEYTDNEGEEHSIVIDPDSVATIVEEINASNVTGTNDGKQGDESR